MVVKAITDWGALAGPVIIFTATMLVGWLAKRSLFRFIQRCPASTDAASVNIAAEAIRQPFMLWVFMLAVHLATQSSGIPQRYADLLAKVLLVLWTVSLTLAAARITSGVVRHYGTRVHSGFQVTSLTENIAGLIVIVLGGLVLLNGLGISITPILTALGVGGLAVALALQDTLSNLFAGFYIMVAGKIRVGDFIKLDSGEEGYVLDISWRSLSIRTLPNNVVIVPNSKVAQAILTNYSLPEKRMSLLINVGVSYDSDPDEIELILVEEAVAASSTLPGLLAEPGPFVRFIPGFGQFSLDFTLIVQVNEFVDQFLVQHELRKRILARFRKEGIEIPFPVHTVHVKSLPIRTKQTGAQS